MSGLYLGIQRSAFEVYVGTLRIEGSDEAGRGQLQLLWECRT